MPPVGLWEPPCRKCFQRLGSQIVKFVSSLPFSGDQAGALQHLEVLGDTLPRHADLIPHEQTRANLKERLAIPLA